MLTWAQTRRASDKLVLPAPRLTTRARERIRVTCRWSQSDVLRRADDGATSILSSPLLQ